MRRKAGENYQQQHRECKFAQDCFELLDGKCMKNHTHYDVLVALYLRRVFMQIECPFIK